MSISYKSLSTHYGIQGKEMKWFQSYLRNRKQCCKVNGFLSKLEDISYGVLRGSCLGPILFLVYINDLHLGLKNSKVNMHADDITICFSFGSIADINKAINADLEDLKIWLKTNKLSLNVLKTQGMIVGKSKRLQKLQQETSTKPSFEIVDNAGKLVGDTKYLGVQVDQG